MRKPVLFDRQEKTKRSKLVLCKCRSQCAKQNPAGEYVSRSTRDNHSRADKLNAHREEATSPNSRWRRALRFKWGSSSASTLRRDRDSSRIKEIEAEVNWHSELPLTSLTTPLVFDKDPLSEGEYVRRASDALLVPNHGLHSLREPSRANTAFLTTEYRLCELASKVQIMPQSDEASAVLNRICDQLDCLDYTKQLQWNHQRAHLTPHKVVVNTGTCQPHSIRMRISNFMQKIIITSVDHATQSRRPRHSWLWLCKTYSL